jgi:hypothetical protein
VSGGPGEDSIATGRGSDRIQAADGSRDRVRCGPGRGDSVSADRIDILSGCENVMFPPRTAS